MDSFILKFIMESFKAIKFKVLEYINGLIIEGMQINLIIKVCLLNWDS